MRYQLWIESYTDVFFFLRGKCWLWCHEKEPENWELIKKFRSLSFIELSYQAKTSTNNTYTRDTVIDILS